MNILKRGSKGSLVAMAQLALKRSGFYSGSLDGVFGTQTESAVRYFQYSGRLPTDGIIGSATWRSLEKYIKGYFKYSLKRGDTYWMLAGRFATSVEAIRRANPGINTNFLQVGQVINIPYGFDAVPVNIPYSSELVSLITEGLLVRYPFLEKRIFGKSVMGKDIFSIEIGKGEKEVSYNAAHHANEWITIPVVMKFLEDYAEAYAAGGRIGSEDAVSLYEKTRLIAVPMVNPDGVDLATEALTEGSEYEAAVNISEHYPNVRFPEGWKANISGTDLNLNYPANWETAKEIKFSQGFVSPAPRDYVGTAPLSAPESRDMYDFTREHDFLLILAYHTQGEIIYWKYLDYDPPRAEEIGNILSGVSGYPLELTPESSSYAGYKDWFIEEFNRPGYTVEAGKGVNPLPLSQFGKIYKDNLGLMIAALSEI
ncbi:MAG: M14 family metallopeptidase [Clostridiales bacterium]|nr:M14 family metallopeptidase [Clostridiales bacterium]